MWNHLTSQLRAEWLTMSQNGNQIKICIPCGSQTIARNFQEIHRTFGWSVNIVFSAGCCCLLAACGATYSPIIRSSFVVSRFNSVIAITMIIAVSPFVCRAPCWVCASARAQTMRPATERRLPSVLSYSLRFLLRSPVFRPLNACCARELVATYYRKNWFNLLSVCFDCA